MKLKTVNFVCKILFILLCLPVFATADKTEKKVDYTIGSEDVLYIQVLGQKDLQRTVEVSQEGTISFPLLGKISVLGRTTYELENDIANKLATEKLLLGAQVSIEVKQYGSQKVYLLGAVKKPGHYFLKGKTHIFAILAEAGGVTNDAGRTITLIRGNAGSNIKKSIFGRQSIHPRKTKIVNGVQSIEGKEIITIDLDDLTQGRLGYSYVLPGDIIKVPEAPKFYVTGEVKKSGEFKWEKQLSVRRAIAMAGGPTKSGSIGRTTIQRFENGTEIELKPEMTDMIQPKDIVIIPQSYF